MANLDAEILKDFRTESISLLKELEEIVEGLEEAGAEFPAELLKEFSQKIDRIMGTAKTLLTLAPDHPGISFLSNVAEMCKTMGYQAAALQRANLVPIFAAFWAETVEMLTELMDALESEATTKVLIQGRSAGLQKRLMWLAEKVAPHSEAEKEKVVALLKKL